MAAAAHGPVHSITTGVDLVAEEAVIVPLLEWKGVVTATIIIAVATAGVIAVAVHPITTARVKLPTMEADQSQ